MARVVVTGAAGRMGTQIVRLVAATPGLALAGAVERAGSPAVGKDAGALAGLEPLGVPVVDELGRGARGRRRGDRLHQPRGLGRATRRSAPRRAWRW